MVTAYMLLSTKIGFEDEIMEKLRGLDEVIEAHSIYGDYDIICKVEMRNPRNPNIVNKIRALIHVDSTLTLIAA